MVRSRDRAILPLLIDVIEHEEEPEQTSGKEQKQEKECQAAKRFLAFLCLFPSRAFLDQFQLERARQLIRVGGNGLGLNGVGHWRKNPQLLCRKEHATA